MCCCVCVCVVVDATASVAAVVVTMMVQNEGADDDAAFAVDVIIGIVGCV